MDVLTISDASKLCGVSLKTITNWIEQGHIKAHKTVGGHRRILREDLYRFMTQQKIPLPEADKSNARKKILVVDDDKIIVETLVLAFEEDEHGYEVCRRIKSSPETQNTRVIVLSAYLDEENFQKMKSFGADACFSKPLPLTELKKEVVRLLDM